MNCPNCDINDGVLVEMNEGDIGLSNWISYECPLCGDYAQGPVFACDAFDDTDDIRELVNQVRHLYD